ncbi:cytochrome bd-I oxidase subunit CydX, partial [Pantoea agglomerans]
CIEPGRGARALAHRFARSRIMWYFSWILGIGVALSFGIVNAMWLEARQKTQEAPVRARRD